ncbi:hypothetical protein DFH09DRAFT_1087372 [Mycena vulgaris]|nr:hypothetical protein DFH09DRAFT_1087372 [Mycena vulgaris]
MVSQSQKIYREKGTYLDEVDPERLHTAAPRTTGESDSSGGRNMLRLISTAWRRPRPEMLLPEEDTVKSCVWGACRVSSGDSGAASPSKLSRYVSAYVFEQGMDKPGRN